MGAWNTHPHAGVVETCQRIEAYSLHGCDCDAPEHRTGEAAIEHLAGLAAGLESAVLGEYQVLGQVRAGLAPLRSEAAWLDGVIAAARQLRAEAAFTATTGQLLDAGLALAGTNARGPLLVIGAGAAGRDVARRAIALGFADVVIASRKAPEANGDGQPRWVPLAELRRQGPFDVVAGCLGAGAEELTQDGLPPAALYLDLGSPANFAESVQPVLTLRTIVTAVRGESADALRRGALRRRLKDLLDARVRAPEGAAAPVARMRRDVEAIRAQEAARIARLHPTLSMEAIDTITRSLVNQILHVPSERLRELGDDELAARFADLFAPAESAE